MHHIYYGQSSSGVSRTRWPNRTHPSSGLFLNSDFLLVNWLSHKAICEAEKRFFPRVFVRRPMQRPSLEIELDTTNLVSAHIRYFEWSVFLKSFYNRMNTDFEIDESVFLYSRNCFWAFEHCLSSLLHWSITSTIFEFLFSSLSEVQTTVIYFS